MKLIRDKMADTPSPNNRLVLIAPEERYRELLRDKLLEEANEVAHAPSHELLVEELADLQEVLSVFLREFKISQTEIWARQETKREERGSFERRVCIL